MATIGDLNIAIGADLTGLSEGLNKAEGQVSNFGSKLGSIAAGFAGLFAIDKLVSFGAAAITTAGDMQALEKGFAATYKGSENLSVALAKVKELAKLPGLGLKEALQGATNLQAAGFSANLATRALGAFGNALATVGKGKADLEGVGLALSQIASKGKISAEEINQLAERVPQIRVAMQAAFGTADTQVLQKAKISATAFVEGVTRELEKLPQVTGGIKNALENVSDATTTFLSKVGDTLNKAFNVEGALDGVSSVLARLGNAFTALGPTLAAAAKFIISKWDTLVGYFGPTGEGGRVFHDLGSAVVDAAKTAGGAIGSIVSAYQELSAVIGRATGTSGSSSKVFAFLVDSLTGALGAFSAAIKLTADLLHGDLTKAFSDAEAGGRALFKPITELFGMGQRLQQLKGSFAEAFTVPDYFTDEVTKATEAVAKFAIAVESKASKALREVEQSLRLVDLNARALGETYDFVAEKTSALESGITKLVANGFNPQGAVILRLTQGLRDLGLAAKLTSKELAGIEPKQTDVALLKEGKAGKLPPVLKPTGRAYLQPYYDREDAAALDFSNKFKGILGAGIADAAAVLGNGLANIISGTQSLGDGLQAVFSGVIGVVADFISQYGKLLIAQATLTLTSTTLASNPYTAPAAIAVGIAAIAAGAALKSFAGGGAFAGGGGGGGGGGSPIASAPRNNFTPTTAPGAADGGRGLTTNIHEVKFVLQGSQLVGALTIETDRLGRVRGR